MDYLWTAGTAAFTECWARPSADMENSIFIMLSSYEVLAGVSYSSQTLGALACLPGWPSSSRYA